MVHVCTYNTWYHVYYTSKRNGEGFVAEGVGSTVLAVIGGLGGGWGISSVRGRNQKIGSRIGYLGHGCDNCFAHTYVCTILLSLQKGVHTCTYISNSSSKTPAISKRKRKRKEKKKCFNLSL